MVNNTALLRSQATSQMNMFWRSDRKGGREGGQHAANTGPVGIESPFKYMEHQLYLLSYKSLHHCKMIISVTDESIN